MDGLLGAGLRVGVFVSMEEWAFYLRVSRQLGLLGEWDVDGS